MTHPSPAGLGWALTFSLLAAGFMLAGIAEGHRTEQRGGFIFFIVGIACAFAAGAFIQYG